ncbi:ShlB/FhaC/HecB family hemolysin secretion/activation protein, partial [Klebsiella quasipneumoniae]
YLSGNRGGYWRNELTGQLLTLPVTEGRLSATGAVDIGHVISQRGITADGPCYWRADRGADHTFARKCV